MTVYNYSKLLCTLSHPSSCRTQISEFENGQIIVYRKCEMSGCEVAWKIKGSRTVIYNFLKNPKEHGKKKHTGRLPILTMHQKCAISR